MELNEIARCTLFLSFTQHNDFADFVKQPDAFFNTYNISNKDPHSTSPLYIQSF